MASTYVLHNQPVIGKCLDDEEASCYDHRMWHVESAHTAASNTKPAAYKTQPLMGQSRTIVGRENIVHRMQTTRAYNAPKPKQKTVQVRDSLTKLSYKQKLSKPEFEGKRVRFTIIFYIG